ncbi:unnamed protein product [Protopolystoma xenopodis]|uniref:Uncharacterized protein n=1 Tax=Protopolystoma xenopodis TaxID=117903 RepID=A0A3S5FCV5_9PLAT|nr:unnamed protein product [Protopolystoma xenopodis]
MQAYHYPGGIVGGHDISNRVFESALGEATYCPHAEQPHSHPASLIVPPGVSGFSETVQMKPVYNWTAVGHPPTQLTGLQPRQMQLPAESTDNPKTPQTAFTGLPPRGRPENILPGSSSLVISNQQARESEPLLSRCGQISEDQQAGVCSANRLTCPGQNLVAGSVSEAGPTQQLTPIHDKLLQQASKPQLLESRSVQTSGLAIGRVERMPAIGMHDAQTGTQNSRNMEEFLGLSECISLTHPRRHKVI